MKTAEANRQLLDWRNRAKETHNMTFAEMAKRIGCSESTLTHKSLLYRLPYLQAMRLKELADEQGKQ